MVRNSEIIRSNNGTEFKNKVMDDFCREKGIKREYSVARTPQQNGVAERRNRTLIEAARSLFADLSYPHTFGLKQFYCLLSTSEEISQDCIDEDGLNNENAEQEKFADDSSTKDVILLVNPARSNENYDSPEDMFHHGVVSTLEASLLSPLIDQQALTNALSDSSWVEACKMNFCYSNSSTEVYVTQPPGFKDPDHPNKVYKVVKALYGLHQAPSDVLLNILLIGKAFVKDGDVDDVLDYPFEPVAYTDSDYARATQDRKSTIRDLLTKGFDAGRFQYLVSNTILGDVNAQTWFEITSKQSNDPPLLRGYTLGSGDDSMKLSELMEICTQLSNKNRKSVLDEFSSLMASLIICLATNQKFNLSKYIFDAMVKHLDGGVKFLMYPCFLQVFINQQLGDMSTHKKIFVNPFHTKKVFANMKRAGKDFSRRITPLFDTMMVQASEEVGEDSDHPIDQPSTSSKPKKKQTSKKTQSKEAEVPQDETEHEESVPTPSNDPQPSGEDSMQLTDLMVLCTKLQTQVLDLEKAKDAQAKEIAALKKRIQRLERKKKSRPTGLKRLKKVGMSRRVESSKDQESLGDPEDASKQGRSIADLDKDDDVTLVDETQERQDDELMFDTRVLDADEMPVEAKVDEKDEQSTKLDDSTAGEAVTTASVEDQIALDEQITRDIQAKLDAELIEEQKLSRKQEEEDNIALIESWENIQAMIEADRLLAERLQSKEREELIDEEKGKLFMELMEKRRKHFAALRAQEKRNRPPTKAQKRTQMSTYLKHMGGYTYKQLKGKSFDEIQKLFDKEMKRVNTFVAMGSKQKSSKKQRIEEDKESDEVEEVEEDDEAELKKHLVIKKDEDIAIDAIPLATKPPVIIDYKLHKEGMMVHYQLIRADGSSKRYSSMIRMLQGIDREDLEALWRIVKTKYSDIRPEDEFERVLWGDLKVMFEPDKRSDVWRILQGYRVDNLVLINSSRSPFVSLKIVHIFMLVEKRYPLTPITITNMLNKKLQTDHQNEMCYQLLKLMVKQQKGQ
ncbi:putative ribonuclease H-like domain-containing protein [Tanacetum coccineum]|uniref:Ribonuclease H-like domain-containing protein n=1 Tax=Tanacetum coccineum TaxID=301880 RepID=A0ABQ5GXY0_9ASTR